jgi:hypothetical protein
MKKRMLVVAMLCAVLVGCAAGPRPTPIPAPPVLSPNKDWTITANWQYDFTNFPACSATLTTGCVTGFTWGYLKGATQIPLKTSPVPFVPCAVPPATQTPPCVDTTTTPLTFHDTANGLVGIGSVTPYVVANGIDNSGNAVSSANDLGPVDTVAMGAAVNFGWTRK